MSVPARQDGGRVGGKAAKPAPRMLVRSPFWWTLSRSSLWLFAKLWLRMRSEGSEQVPGAGPVLLVANHTSYLDPPLVGSTCRRWVAFLAQAGLARFAPMRWWLRQVGVTLIDRDAPSTAALRLVADSLAAGEVVGIVPEGTRSRDGSIAPFRSGVEFLVRRTGAIVVPIGIDGAFRAFPRGALLPRPRKVIVRYGEPWPPERVLAPGGVEALRRRIAELARAPLRGAETPTGRAGQQEQRTDADAVAPSATTPSSSSSSSSAGGEA